MTKDYEIHRRSVSNVFGKGHTYMIPTYQRRYTWAKDNAERLFDNLIEMASKDELSSTNLLGAIVVVDGKEGFEYEVVDGQQRLATLSMIFTAIQTCLRKFSGMLNDAEPSLEDALSRLDNLLKVKAKSTESVKIRVEMNESDSQLFQEIINNEKSDYRTFCKNLRKNYESGKKRIDKSHTLMIDNYLMVGHNLFGVFCLGFGF